MVWDIFDICVFHVAQNMWDFHIGQLHHFFSRCVGGRGWSLENDKIIKSGEIKFSLESLQFGTGKRFMVEHYSKVTLKEPEAHTRRHTHAHTRTSVHKTPSSARGKELCVFFSMLSISFTFWNKYIMLMNTSWGRHFHWQIQNCT